MTPSESLPTPAICPCGSNKSYAECCGPLHAGEPAANAEALMRSRYSAFAMNLMPYVERTWHPSTRPKQVAGEEAVNPQWIGLRVKRHEVIDEDRAIVEFSARYKLAGRVFTLHEISRFVRENGSWFYLDGKQPRR